MALSAEGEKLLQHALAALPTWFTSAERPQEDLAMAAKIIEAARAQAAHWFDLTLITQAVGPVGDEPDWLNFHARDRNTSRQDGETDAALQERLRHVADAITFPVLREAIEAVLEAEGIEDVEDLAFVELTYDRAFMHAWVSDAGTGGEFFGTAPNMEFQPTVPFEVGRTMVATASLYKAKLEGSRLVISGAAEAGNNGTFTITGLNGDRVQFQNATGVADEDATASWTHRKHDQTINNLQMDGFASTYLSRGYRITDILPRKFIAILPYGSTPGTAAGVIEALRQKKAAGLVAILERRLTPTGAEEDQMGYLPESWEKLNVGISLTDVVVPSSVSTLFDTLPMDRAGSIVSIASQFSTAIAGGTLTVNVTKNGAAVFSAAHTSGTGTVTTQAAGTDTFVAGDLIGVTVTTDGSFSPTTLDMRVLVGVIFAS